MALAAFEESGLTMAAFAAREGLDRQRLQRWCRTLGARAGAPAFEEIPRAEVVRALATEPEARNGGFEVVLTSGRIVRVPRAFDTATLRRLLAVLDGVDAC